jgi:hypothetical protein
MRKIIFHRTLLKGCGMFFLPLLKWSSIMRKPYSMVEGKVNFFRSLVLILGIMIFWEEGLAFSGPSCGLQKNNCRYYLCQNEIRGCSAKNNYLKEFGFKYCKKFLMTDQSNFTTKGKKWLKDVRYCLMKKLSQVSSKVSCEGLKLRAHLHHIECYYQKGFCQLAFSDRRKVLKLIAPELKRPEVILSGVGLFLACYAKEGRLPPIDLTMI